jgi:hypothetical protein
MDFDEDEKVDQWESEVDFYRGSIDFGYHPRYARFKMHAGFLGLFPDGFGLLEIGIWNRIALTRGNSS